MRNLPEIQWYVNAFSKMRRDESGLLLNEVLNCVPLLGGEITVTVHEDGKRLLWEPLQKYADVSLKRWAMMSLVRHEISSLFEFLQAIRSFGFPGSARLVSEDNGQFLRVILESTYSSAWDAGGIRSVERSVCDYANKAAYMAMKYLSWRPEVEISVISRDNNLLQGLQEAHISVVFGAPGGLRNHSKAELRMLSKMFSVFKGIDNG